MNFKAYIRVVKSLKSSNQFMDQFYDFKSIDIVHEPLIQANSKENVKQILLEKYPQFFPNAKVYERETKDQAQFFYVVIFPLFNWEQAMIDQGPWTCSCCGQVHENKYFHQPIISEKLFGLDKLFCRSNDNVCLKNYTKETYRNVDLMDDLAYVKKDSPHYIYKCTEKSTSKSYIGKTRNEPFFRWWNHLTHSQSPFGIYLRQTKLSDWTFEVLEILPTNTPDSEIFRIESEYILQHNSIAHGFNTIISQKSVLDRAHGTLEIFENQ